MRLDGRVAVVTGAAKGIGRGIARVFAAEACRVVIADIDETAGAEVVRDITAAGGTATFVRTDVRDSLAIAAAIDVAVATYGRLDVLVNNAGWHPPATTIDDTTLELFESQLRLNLTSTFLGCKYAVPFLRKTRGCIISMASMVGLLGQRDAAAYCASKAGQIGLTKALAVELAPVGVRVNCICPAGVDTPLLHEWARSLPDPQAGLRQADAMHALGRMATPEEIGRAALFLATEDSSFVTGHALAVDGGASLDY